MTAPVPAALAQNAVQVWGEAGRQWLSDLPDLVETVAERWHLRVGDPFVLSYHWVAPAELTDGTRTVVKLGVPGEKHLRQEAKALTAFDGRGAVRLLGFSETLGALLLERADPGTMAASVVPHRDSDATNAIIGIAQRLHRQPPAACALPPLEQHGRGFTEYLARFGDAGPLPRALVEQARSLFTDLCASASERTLLHGDLHHDNVLDAGDRGWLAIDPHGLVGDPGFDVGAMLYNPMHPAAPDGLLDLVPARVEQLADGLGMTLERTCAWGFTMAVLSEVWTCEDGAPPEGPPLLVARLLQQHI